MNFPPVLVINLDERKDRWRDVQNSFSSWPIQLQRFPAVRKNPGWKGCLESHKKAVRYAMEQKYPWVLVLEDDCFPAQGKKTYEQFVELLPYLWEIRDQWEIFSGGPTFLLNQTVLNEEPPLFHIKGYATHFILLNVTAYQKILDLPEEKPIDVLYAERMNCVCTIPHLAFQKEGVSDVQGAYANYIKIFDESKTKLMKTLDDFQKKEKERTKETFINQEDIMDESPSLFHTYKYEAVVGFTLFFSFLTLKVLANRR